MSSGHTDGRAALQMMECPVPLLELFDVAFDLFLPPECKSKNSSVQVDQDNKEAGSDAKVRKLISLASELYAIGAKGFQDGDKGFIMDFLNDHSSHPLHSVAGRNEERMDKAARLVRSALHTRESNKLPYRGLCAAIKSKLVEGPSDLFTFTGPALTTKSALKEGSSLYSSTTTTVSPLTAERAALLCLVSFEIVEQAAKDAATVCAKEVGNHLQSKGDVDSHEALSLLACTFGRVQEGCQMLLKTALLRIEGDRYRHSCLHKGTFERDSSSGSRTLEQLARLKDEHSSSYRYQSTFAPNPKSREPPCILCDGNLWDPTLSLEHMCISTFAAELFKSKVVNEQFERYLTQCVVKVFNGELIAETESEKFELLDELLGIFLKYRYQWTCTVVNNALTSVVRSSLKAIQTLSNQIDTTVDATVPFLLRKDRAETITPKCRNLGTMLVRFAEACSHMVSASCFAKKFRENARHETIKFRKALDRAAANQTTSTTGGKQSHLSLNPDVVIDMDPEALNEFYQKQRADDVSSALLSLDDGASYQAKELLSIISSLISPFEQSKKHNNLRQHSIIVGTPPSLVSWMLECEINYPSQQRVEGHMTPLRALYLLSLISNVRTTATNASHSSFIPVFLSTEVWAEGMSIFHTQLSEAVEHQFAFLVFDALSSSKSANNSRSTPFCLMIERAQQVTKRILENDPDYIAWKKKENEAPSLNLVSASAAGETKVKPAAFQSLLIPAGADESPYLFYKHVLTNEKVLPFLVFHGLPTSSSDFLLTDAMMDALLVGIPALTEMLRYALVGTCALGNPNCRASGEASKKLINAGIGNNLLAPMSGFLVFAVDRLAYYIEMPKAANNVGEVPLSTIDAFAKLVGHNVLATANHPSQINKTASSLFGLFKAVLRNSESIEVLLKNRLMGRLLRTRFLGSGVSQGGLMGTPDCPPHCTHERLLVECLKSESIVAHEWASTIGKTIIANVESSNSFMANFRYKLLTPEGKTIIRSVGMTPEEVGFATKQSTLTVIHADTWKETAHQIAPLDSDKFISKNFLQGTHVLCKCFSLFTKTFRVMERERKTLVWSPYVSNVTLGFHPNKKRRNIELTLSLPMALILLSVDEATSKALKNSSSQSTDLPPVCWLSSLAEGFGIGKVANERKETFAHFFAALRSLLFAKILLPIQKPPVIQEVRINSAYNLPTRKADIQLLPFPNIEMLRRDYDKATVEQQSAIHADPESMANFDDEVKQADIDLEAHKSQEQLKYDAYMRKERAKVAVLRTLKSNPSNYMSHQDLTGEVLKALINYNPSVSAIKEATEYLIERGFVERHVDGYRYSN